MLISPTDAEAIARFHLQPSPSVPYVLGTDRFEQNGGFRVRITEDARRSVVFFGVAAPPSGEIEYSGTGFLLAYKTDGIRFPYLVTNRHVAKHLEKFDEFFIRANLKGGGSEPISIQSATWIYHDDENVDLAAAFIHLEKQTYDHGFFGGGFRYSSEVYCGDPVSIVGLFRLRSGNSKNVPVVHSGHIATLPDPDEPIPIRDQTTNELRHATSYLIEAQTLDGLSGAPVFAREVFGFRSPSGVAGVMYSWDVRLLGVYQGSFKGVPDETKSKGLGLPENKLVPVGMGIVVPAERIDELMQHEDLAYTRQELSHMGIPEEKVASTDAAFPSQGELEPPTRADNPQHKEDFNRLLGAATVGPKEEPGT